MTGCELLKRDNALIRSIYTGSRIESKILLHAMYAVQKSKKLITTYTTEELVNSIEIAGCSETGTMLHRIVPRLLNHKVIICKDNGRAKSTEGFNVVSYCKYEDGFFTIELNKRILPYLIDIESPFTTMRMGELMEFGTEKKSKNFAIRLYEILRTKQYILETSDSVSETFTLADLKIRTGLINIDNVQAEEVIREYNLTDEALVQLGGDPYPVWRDFRRRILEPAIKEINLLASSDFTVSYKTKKAAAGKIVGITFTIHSKYIDAGFHADTDDPSVKEISSDVIYGQKADLVRSMITEEIGDDSIGRILDAAGGDTEKVRAAYELAEKQTGEIRDITSWMVSAVKGGWAEKWKEPVSKQHRDDPENAAVQERSKGSAYKYQDQKAFSHEKKFGFEPNSYDFDALEEELLARGYGQSEKDTLQE